MSIDNFIKENYPKLFELLGIQHRQSELDPETVLVPGAKVWAMTGGFGSSWGGVRVVADIEVDHVVLANPNDCARHRYILMKDEWFKRVYLLPEGWKYSGINDELVGRHGKLTRLQYVRPMDNE